MKNKKGFTMIELLATVTILGILMTITIGYAMRLINKSKNDSMEQQAKLVTTAAESYFQAHREQLPRLVGQTTKIPINTLLETNYLKKSIKNAKGESCMEKSFITAYKASKTKYTYKAYLYCGNDIVPPDSTSQGPEIKIDFCREETGTCLYKDKDEEVKKSVADAIISIEINGNKPGEEEANLEGYIWSISAQYQGESKLKEVYNSGELSAKGHKSIKIPKETSKQKYILKNYLDLTNTTDIVVKVIATNEKGGISEEQRSILYQDTNPPICGTREGESSTWINKKTPLTDAVRIISVECKDGNGSGCVRNKFTQIWPTSTETTVEKSSIKIEDNAGISNNCEVNVNIDIEAPVIKLEKATTDGNTNILNLGNTSNTTAGTTNDSVTLSEDKYKNLNNNWMNKANYQNGVTYTFTISDNYQLASWKFETNNTEESGSDQIAGTSKQIQVSFNKDGRRQGKLTVIDKAGNTATYTVKANLDREVPPVPNVYLRKWKNNNGSAPRSRNGLEEYIEGTWSNKNIYTVAEKNAETVTSPSHLEIVTEGATQNHNENEHLERKYWNVKAEGTSTVRYRTCDEAGNCSEYNSKTIKLDKTAPELVVNMRTYENIEPTSISNNDQNKYYGEDTNMNVYIKPEVNDNLSGINAESYKISDASTNNYKEKHCKYKQNGDEDTSFYTKCPPSLPSTIEYGATSYRKFSAGDKYTVTQEGKTKVSFQVSDNAGNTKEITKYVSIDKTKPYAIFACFRLKPDIIPSFDKVNEVGKNQDFQIIADSQDFWYSEIKKNSGYSDYYGILIEYYDNFSSNYLSREIINGDRGRCPDKGNGNYHEADCRGNFNTNTGYYEKYCSLRDGPASASEIKSLIKNVCDRAGNCAYTTGRKIDCVDKINGEVPLIDKADNYFGWNSDCDK